MKLERLVTIAPHMVLAMLLVLFSTTATRPAYAKQQNINANAKSTAKTFLLRQSTQWAADIRIVISPTLMQLDADHLNYSLQYSKKHRSLCAWNTGTKRYATTSLDSWLRTFRNVAMSVTWTADLEKATTVSSTRQNDFKVNRYVFENIQVAQAYFSSEIGLEKKQPPGTGFIETVELGCDPNVEVILNRLSALPTLNGVPFAAYFKNRRSQPYNTLITTEFQTNPKIPPLKLFEPKGYTETKRFTEIMVPQSSIQELL